MISWGISRVRRAQPQAAIDPPGTESALGPFLPRLMVQSAHRRSPLTDSGRVSAVPPRRGSRVHLGQNSHRSSAHYGWGNGPRRNQPTDDSSRPELSLASQAIHRWQCRWVFQAADDSDLSTASYRFPPSRSVPAELSFSIKLMLRNANSVVDTGGWLNGRMVLISPEAVTTPRNPDKTLSTALNTWAVRYLLVDTRNWWPGKQVLVPLSHVRDGLRLDDPPEALRARSDVCDDELQAD